MKKKSEIKINKYYVKLSTVQDLESTKSILKVMNVRT